MVQTQFGANAFLYTLIKLSSSRKTPQVADAGDSITPEEHFISTYNSIEATRAKQGLLRWMNIRSTCDGAEERMDKYSNDIEERVSRRNTSKAF